MLACAAAWSAPAAASPVAAPAPVQAAPAEELLLLAPQIDGMAPQLEPLTVYRRGEIDWVPLGQLASALQLAVSVDPDRGAAQGFIIDSTRRFTLDARALTASVGGEELALPAAQVAVRDGDIYVSTQLLSQLWPIDVSVDLAQALLHVEPREELPVQAAARRAELAESIRVGDEAPQYPLVPNPFAVASGPFVDMQLGAALAGATGRAAQSGLSYRAHVAGDFLGMNGALDLAGSDQAPLESSSFRLEQRSPQGELLDNLHARLFAVGAVTLPGLPDVTFGGPLNGLYMSSFPLSMPEDYGSKSFAGPLPSGWQAALYRNGILIGYDDGAGGSGRYAFTDVALAYGENRFELILFGPEGQRERHVYVYTIGAKIVPKGQSYYQFAFGWNDADQPESMVRADTGWSDSTALSFGAMTVADDRRLTYGRAGVTSSAGGFLLNAGVTMGTGLRDERGPGFAVDAGAQTRWRGVSLGLQHTQFHNFTSPIYPNDRGDLAAIDRFSLAALPKLGPLSLPLGIDVQQSTRRDGSAVGAATLKNSFTLHSFDFSNWLTYAWSPGKTPTTDGTFMFDRRLGGGTLLLQLGYAVAPVTHLQRLSADFSRKLGAGYAIDLGFAQALDGSDRSISLQLSHQADRYSFGGGMKWSSDGSYELSLGLSFSLGHAPPALVQFGPPGMAQGGAAQVRAFQDTNLNRTYDPGEPLLAGVGVLVDGRPKTGRTNGEGTLLMTDLPTDRAANLSIDPSTLQDPLARPEIEGLALVARPGAPAWLDLPVVLVGELSGTVYLARGAAQTGVSGVQLELVDAAGAVAGSTVSLYGGFYDFSGVLPGRYVLRVAPEQAARLKLTVKGMPINVPPQGALLDGIDYVVAPASPAG